MKYLIVLMALIMPLQVLSASSSHYHSSPASDWNENTLDAWQGRDAYVTINVRHVGQPTPYYIEVNNQQVSNVFIMEGDETLELDVPVVLEYRHGGQNFNVCSVGQHGNTGSRFCTKVELFMIEGSDR